MRLVVLFHRLGPYHHARLKAAGGLCKLTALELSAVDNTYAWSQVPGAENFRRITLFGNTDVEEKPPFETHRKLWAMLDDCDPQVLAIPGWGTPSAIMALEWCLRSKIPAVVMSESTLIDEPRVWWKEWSKSQIVRQFHTGLVGGTSHVDYLERLGMSREMTFIGYDVVDNEHFSNGAETARFQLSDLLVNKSLPEKYFFNSSRFVEKKNLLRLVDAYANYQRTAGKEAWHLVIIGDGPLMSVIEEKRTSLELQSWVHLPGFKQYDELPTYYGLASAYVQASTTEQWGLVVNEAMASGLPVIVSENCGCVSDLVQFGVNGYTFDPYNVRELACLMHKLAGGDSNLEAMGQASQEIISRWTPETFAENLVKAAQMAIEAPSMKFSGFNRLLLKCLSHR